MPFMKHGVLGGPRPKSKKITTIKFISKASLSTKTEEKSSEMCDVVIVNSEESTVTEEKVLPITEELDPILEEDKGYEPSEDLVEEKPKWVSKKQKKLLKLTGESK